jgi:periplasmic divalent cation tolerance protein
VDAGVFLNAVKQYRVSIASTSSKYRIRRKSTSPIVKLVLVLTTLGADTDAPAFARTLVEERLAACVNVLPPMTSIYRWKGSVEKEREQQLLIKTAADRVEALAARLRELHPYELPEFIVLNAEASTAYAEWVDDNTRAG